MKTDIQTATAEVKLPPEIQLVSEPSEQLAELNRSWEDTARILEDATRKKAELLTKLNLRSDDLGEIADLQLRIALAPEKLADLEARVSSVDAQLIEASRAAVSIINRAATQAARGQLEVTANAIAPNFTSIDEARLAVRSTKSVTDLADKAMHSQPSLPPPPSEHILARARELFAALEQITHAKDNAREEGLALPTLAHIEAAIADVLPPAQPRFQKDLTTSARRLSERSVQAACNRVAKAVPGRGINFKDSPKAAESYGFQYEQKPNDSQICEEIRKSRARLGLYYV